MENTKIYKAMVRLGFTEATNNHYVKTLNKLEQNEWIYVSNEEFEFYSICDWFSSVNLICKKIVPKFSRTGSYLGNTIYFYWNKDLNYTKL